jgi:hypothetical protein
LCSPRQAGADPSFRAACNSVTVVFGADVLLGWDRPEDMVSIGILWQSV